MPAVLRDDASTPYPIKKINLDRIDSNLDYFVIRKDLNNNNRLNIGEIKVIDDINSEVFLAFLDCNRIDRLGSYDELSNIFKELMKDYEIICITDEDTSKASLGGSVGFDSENYKKLRAEMPSKLFNMVEMGLINRR